MKTQACFLPAAQTPHGTRRTHLVNPSVHKCAAAAGEAVDHSRSILAMCILACLF